MSGTVKDFREELRTYITTSPSIAGKIGARFYALLAPQNATAPYCVGQIISSGQGHAHDGPTGLEEFRFQIDIYAATIADCDSIRDLIKGRLDGFRGKWTKVFVGYCFFDTETDFYDDTTKLRRKSIDFRFMVSY